MSLSQAKKTRFLHRASIAEDEKKSEAENVIDYVKSTRKSLKLDLLNLQNQLETLNSISEMPDSVKMRFLFSHLDKDSNRRISASELSEGLRKMNAGMSFQEGLDQAIENIAMYDINVDGTLDFGEFKSFMEKLTNLAGVTSQEVSELILMQVIFSKSGNTSVEKVMLTSQEGQINEKVKKLAEYYSAFNDIGMRELFGHFDSNGDGTLDFKEVSRGLFKIKGSMSEATKLALDVILLTDEDDNRLLDYNEFVRLILHVCALEGDNFDDVANEFIVNMYFEEDADMEDEIELIEAEEFYDAYQKELALYDELGEVESMMDILKYAKMQKLFDLWDINNDEVLSWEELALGLQKYQRSIDDTVILTNNLMEEYDEGKDKTLNKQEFALLLVKIAKEGKNDLHKMIDTLATISLLEENSEDEEKYIKALAYSRVVIDEENNKNVEKNDEIQYSLSFKNFVNENEDEEMWA